MVSQDCFWPVEVTTLERSAFGLAGFRAHNAVFLFYSEKNALAVQARTARTLRQLDLTDAVRRRSTSSASLMSATGHGVAGFYCFGGPDATVSGPR